MKMKCYIRYCLILLGIILFQYPGNAQNSEYRPGLCFREDWKEIPAENPVTQKHVNNPELILELYGPGKDSIKKSHHASPADDPYYIWSGQCPGTWALTLNYRNHLVDLSDFAKIKWRSKQYGFRELHVLLKLVDDTWLVSTEGDPASGDWRIREFNLQDLHWYSIDMNAIAEMKPVEAPDLSRVKEIGFTDLMTGGKSNACSRLDWIEVYGYLVPLKSD